MATLPWPQLCHLVHWNYLWLLCRLREAQLCHLVHWNYLWLLCRLREAQLCHLVHWNYLWLLCRLREAQLCHLVHWNYLWLLCRLREAQHIQYKSSHCLLPCPMTPLFESSFLAVHIKMWLTAVQYNQHQTSADCSRLWGSFEGQPVRKGHSSWRMFFWRSNWFPRLTRKMEIDKIVLNQLLSYSAPSDPKSTPISWCLHNINTHREYKSKLSKVPFRSKRNCLIYIVLAVRIANCSHFIYLPSRGNKYRLFKLRI